MGNYDYNILNKDEGSLIIWAPDSRADFMNHEKAEHLRSLESAENRWTTPTNLCLRFLILLPGDPSAATQKEL